MALPAPIQAILARFRGSNNNAYSAGSNPLGMGQGGHRQNFNPRLGDMADLSDWMSSTADGVEAGRAEVATNKQAASDSAGAAATSAQSAADQVPLAAAQAQRLAGTSTTSNTSTIASKTFTTQADKAFDVGSYVHIQSRGTLNRWMEGRVTAYSGTSLTVAVERIGTTTSAGTDWDIRVSAVPGIQGIQGVPGIGTLGYAARSSNTQLVTADSAHWYDLTGTFTQTFAAVSAIGVDWYVVLKNAGTGDITLDPNGSETIDGLTSFIMYPGEVRLIQCDGTTFRSVVIAPGAKVFTASGSFIVPPGINGIDVDTIGGGGGGHGGRKGLLGSTDANGGNGGGGGERRRARVTAPAPGTAITVTVGSGGTGGGATASANNQINGSNGGDSSFGALVKAKGGFAGGVGGTSTSAVGGLAYGSQASGSGNPSEEGGAGGSLTSTTPVSGGASLYAGAGGGAGAFINSGSSIAEPASGGETGTFRASSTLGAGGAAGVSSSLAAPTPGGNGGNGSGDLCGQGGGGGGGTNQNTQGISANGARGGDGGAPGGGGGGGGGLLENGTTARTSGAGGNGGRGEVRVRMF